MQTGLLLTLEVSVMKTKLAAAALATMTLVLPWASALADGPRASSFHAIGQPAEKPNGLSAIPHYEWQYHYAVTTRSSKGIGCWCNSPQHLRIAARRCPASDRAAPF
jgi:hypothetical protein